MQPAPGSPKQLAYQVQDVQMLTMLPAIIKPACLQQLCLPPWIQAQAAASASYATKTPPQSRSSLKKLGLQQVQHIIAVSSAKGGVGKSTTAVNLAVALATSLGLRVGLLDADIHGPSIGKMMNLKGQPAVQQEGQPLMLPKENYRVATMSMAYFMASEDQPAMWRGPMTSNAFDKMAFGTAWGQRDYLIVDLPPGTGDAQINLAQRLPLTGAIIVSTPQDIALMDAKRGTQLFRKLGVPILGMVENMSYHTCSKCGHKDYIFGHEGVLRTAEQYNLNVLAQVPLHTAIREQSDAGVPIVISQPEHPCAQAYVQLAQHVVQQVQQLGPAWPKITLET